MTYYHGGKKRIGSKVADIIEQVVEIFEDYGYTCKGYCEPFVGMAGVYKHIPKIFGDSFTYLAGDANKNIIDFWKKAVSGWKPPSSCSKSQWLKYKKSTSNSPQKTFCGYATDFRGHYYRGFCDKQNVAIQRENVIETAKELKRTKFTHGTYTQFSHLKHFIVYCDPPYDNTEQYKNIDKFDSEAFWDWCRDMARDNVIIVSEYIAPRDAILIGNFQERRRSTQCCLNILSSYKDLIRFLENELIFKIYINHTLND